MADLPEIESYDTGVYQYEVTDPVRGGVDGVDNKPIKNLANRTKWLKARVDALDSEDTMTAHKSAADPHTGYAIKAGVQGAIYTHATAGGTSDAITAVYTPAYAAWSDGMAFSVKITATNTITTPTVSPSGLAAKTVVKGAGVALRAQDLVVGMIAEFKYSLTLDKCILQNPDTGISGIVVSGINIVTTTSVLSYAMAGGLVRFNSAIAITPSLPLASSYAAGKGIRCINNNVGVATLTRTGADTITVNNTTVTALALSKGDTLELLSDGVSTWYAIGGSVQLPYSNLFRGGSGYSVLADGTILQRGTVVTNSSGYINATFPIPFPNAFEMTMLTAFGTFVMGGVSTPTVSTLSQQVIYSTNGAAAPAGVQVNYVAIGR
jgi:hypothetical protein